MAECILRDRYINAQVLIKGITLRAPPLPTHFIEVARESGQLWIEDCTIAGGSGVAVSRGGSLWVRGSKFYGSVSSVISIEGSATLAMISDSRFVGCAKGLKCPLEGELDILPGEHGAIELLLPKVPQKKVLPLAVERAYNESALLSHHSLLDVFELRVHVNIRGSTIESNLGCGVCFRSETTYKSENHSVRRSLPAGIFERAVLMESNSITANGVGLPKDSAPADGPWLVENTSPRGSLYAAFRAYASDQAAAPAVYEVMGQEPSRWCFALPQDMELGDDEWDELQDLLDEDDDASFKPGKASVYDERELKAELNRALEDRQSPAKAARHGEIAVRFT
jgi:hypothetical protein